MGQARRGRPRKAGPRNSQGRLITLPDRGNDVVQARAARFARLQDGKAEQQVADQIGRAWAAGLLDGHGYDGAMLRDIGRRYGGLYWNEFATLAPKTRALEKCDRAAANDGGEDRAGEYFATLDTLARSAGRDAITALHSLCVDGWWFPDTDQPWLARLIDAAMAERIGAIANVRPYGADGERLRAATEALIRMVEGRRKGATRP